MYLKEKLEDIINTSTFVTDVAVATKLVNIKTKWDRGEYNSSHVQAWNDIYTVWTMHSRDIILGNTSNSEFWKNFHMLGKCYIKFQYLCLDKPLPN